MSTLKTKIGTVAAAALFAALSSTQTFAQIGVYDNDAHDYLEKIRDNTKAVKDFHEDKTSAHYDAELKRLDEMIKSLSYFNPGEGTLRDKTEDELKVYDREEEEKTSRETISKVAEGEATNLGYEIDEMKSGLVAYRAKYGLLKPSEIHSEAGLALYIQMLHGAGYAAEATAGEVNAGQEKRLERYNLLEERARAAKTSVAALEVNNALLLENGRNLATLLNMEAAGLNAEATMLRTQAKSSQAGAEAFGSSLVSTAILNEVVNAF